MSYTTGSERLVTPMLVHAILPKIIGVARSVMGRGDIHKFMLTNRKNNRSQKKLILPKTNNINTSWSAL